MSGEQLVVNLLPLIQPLKGFGTLRWCCKLFISDTPAACCRGRCYLQLAKLAKAAKDAAAVRGHYFTRAGWDGG